MERSLLNQQRCGRVSGCDESTSAWSSGSSKWRWSDSAVDEVGETTEAGEDMEKSENIASVTECIPVDCVAKACCTPSLLLDVDVSSSMAGPDLRH